MNDAPTPPPSSSPSESPRGLADYLDPTRATPPERPSLDHMTAATRDLHRAIDDGIRARGVPYLNPQSETLQLDLLGSPAMIEWQESKALQVFEGERCWSDLPQVYARYGTEATRELLGRVRDDLEGAAGAVLTDCGMQACALLFDALVRPRCHCIIMRQVYNKTRKYLERLCELTGSELTIVDDGDTDALEAAVRPETVLVFVETFTNPLMRAADPAWLGDFAQRHRTERGARSLRVILDTTIATPWSFRQPALSHPGVDFVVASGTKALAGADCDLWGYVASNRIDTLNEVMDLQAMRGGILDWRRARAILALLPRAEERFAERCDHAARVAAFLDAHPEVKAVHHPSLLQSHPDRAAIEAHYRRPGSLLSFRLRDADEDAARHFADVLATTVLPRYALSFDGLATKLNHHRTVSEYFTPAEELSRAGIDRLIRLGVGLEAPDDLIACLNWALSHHRRLTPDDTARWRSERARDLGIYPEQASD